MSSFGVVHKKDRGKDVAVGAAAAGGALAAQSAYIGGGVALNNKVIYPKFARSRETWTDEQKAAWKKHNTPPENFPRSPAAQYPPGTSKNGKGPAGQRHYDNIRAKEWQTSKDFFRKFPKELPTWKARRIMGYAGKGKTGHAVSLGLMGAGATASGMAAHRGMNRKKVAKGIGQYVPKAHVAADPRLILKDPGFVVPVLGVTAAGGAGVAGSALARRKRRRKK